MPFKLFHERVSWVNIFSYFYFNKRKESNGNTNPLEK